MLTMRIVCDDALVFTCAPCRVRMRTRVEAGPDRCGFLHASAFRPYSSWLIGWPMVCTEVTYAVN